jgi:hypothetical protein
MDVLAAAASRPIVIFAAVLAATGAPSFAVAGGGPQQVAVLPGAPVPLYLKAAELSPAVLLEWAQPDTNTSTPIDITGLTQQNQNQQTGGGGGGTSDTPKGQPEPASLISAFSGVGLAGLAAWLRRRRRGAADEAPPEEWPDEDEEEAGE